jgi:hypothetical protein
MYSKRRFLIYLLCVLLPMQTLAYVPADRTPCPMMQSDADHSGFEHDCCNDADAVARTGKLCKPAQECSSGASVLVFAAILLSPLPVFSAHWLARAPIALTVAPAGIWRPPTPL